jgi:iron complex outermembrane receptor protein
MPVENKQRVELLKGVSALYYGFAMPSGILNLVTKRAGSQPVTSLYSTADTEGGFGGGFDVGRRFGADDRFGLRINGYGADLQSTTNGVSGHRQLISGAFDWQVDDRLTIKADVEYYHRSGQEPGGITLPTAVSGKITLPAVPDPSLRFAPENAVFTTWGMNAALRADYAISDKWSARVEGGVSEAHRNRMISTLGSVNLTTGAGRDAITYTPGQFWENRYGRAGWRGIHDRIAAPRNPAGGCAHRNVQSGSVANALCDGGPEPLYSGGDPAIGADPVDDNDQCWRGQL